jgi:hypothetical protein
MTWRAISCRPYLKAITNLLDSPVGDDRELAIVLWLLWAVKSGGKVGRCRLNPG